MSAESPSLIQTASIQQTCLSASGVNVCLNHLFLVVCVLQDGRSVFVTLWIVVFLAGNIAYLYYTFSSEELYNRYLDTLFNELLLVHHHSY